MGRKNENKAKRNGREVSEVNEAEDMREIKKSGCKITNKTP